MKSKSIIEDPNLSFEKKKEYLFSQPKELDTYKEYYAGIQKIKKRQHPNDSKKTAKLNKIVVNYTRDIVDFHAGFLFSNFVELKNNSNEKLNNIYKKFLDNWNDSKLSEEYLLMSKELFGYSRTAEFIYNKEDQKVRHKLFSQLTNQIDVNFDNGSLDCFMREFKDEIFIDGKVENVDYFEFYYLSEDDGDKTKLVTYQKIGNGKWEEQKEKKEFNKMPIIWYEIDQPIWWSVKDILDRINENISVTADVIDFVSYPIMMLYGQLMTNADGETIQDSLYKGKNLPKLLHFKTDDNEKSEGKYLESNNKNETYTKEYITHKEVLENITATADTSFTSMKGIGNISGVALKLLFLKTLTKSTEYQNAFFLLSRSINLTKFYMAEAYNNKLYNDLIIEVIFNNTIPENELENQEILNKEVEALTNAVFGKILSIETAIELNPYVKDSVEEMERIKKESRTLIS